MSCVGRTPSRNGHVEGVAVTFEVRKTRETDAESAPSWHRFAQWTHNMSLTFFPSDCSSELHCSHVNQGWEVTLKSKVMFVPARSIAVRTAPKMKRKPPTSITLGDDSYQGSEGASTLQNAEIVQFLTASFSSTASTGRIHRLSFVDGLT